MESSAIKCAECGRDMEEERNSQTRLPCPDCGSLIRRFYQDLDLNTVTSFSVLSEVRDNSGSLKYKDHCKDDISENTRRPVKTTISIDVTDPNNPKKYHKVEELDEHGIFYKTIHEHTDIQRPKSTKKRKK